MLYLLLYVMSTGPRSFSWLRPLSLTRKRKISMSCKKQFAKKIYIYKFWFCDRNVDSLMLATKASTRCHVRPLKAEGIWGPVQASGGRQMPPVCYLRNGRVISFMPSLNQSQPNTSHHWPWDPQKRYAYLYITLNP